MTLRDTVEQLIREWDAHEQARGASTIIDFDCLPGTAPADITPAESRLDVYHQLRELLTDAERDGDRPLCDRLRADIAYVSALLGERQPLDDYLTATQGCPAAGWPDDYVTAIGERAKSALADLGIGWSADTDAEMTKAEGPIDITDAPDAIRAAAADREPIAREVTGTTAPYTLTITTDDVDAYWAYWLDGAGSALRLRFNRRRATFTQVRIRQFAQHEILGHALQCATYAARARATDVPWVRLFSVHTPREIMSEGLAQAFPLILSPTDTPLVARVRLDHYLQLVRAELHRAINAGASIPDCVDHAHARVPWWTPAVIGDVLTDRNTDPLLRSYLWAYPAGIDWFVTLADTADPTTVGKVLRAAYTQPLTPADLTTLWPTGPTLGGPGAPLRLRKPPVP